MSLPDLLRLLAVPLLGWAALRDYRTRRVPARTWYPLLVLGIVLLVWDAALVLGDPFQGRLFLLRAGLSVGLLVPLAYAFHRLGGFGAADAKAFAVLAVLFPVYPAYELGPLALPLEPTPLGVFSLTVVTDGVLLGALYPVAVAARNALAGRFSRAMLVGRPVPWDEVEATHGKLLETPDGFTLSGLDLDALRMYLRWRGLTLADVRERPDELRDPASLPAEPNPPTGGAVATDGGGDPWGAAAFLEDVGSAYGTTPGGLRDGLDLLADADTVWVSPGIPFLVPLFLGLLVALSYGDLLYGLLGIVGLA